MSRVRPIVLGVVRRGQELLVQHVPSPAVDGDAYRFLGGGIEFGERSESALHREFDEELGVTLTDVSGVGWYEDIFEHEGREQHEIWRVYEASIEDDWPYKNDTFTFHEPDLEMDLDARWLHPSEIHDGTAVLYGEEVLDDLNSETRPC